MVPKGAFPKLAVYDPLLSAEDVASVGQAVAEGFVSGTSPLVGRFEAAYAEHCGMAHAVAVSSGTAALELAVAGLKLGPGDEVLCPAFTIISCVRSIVLAGARPVLVDVDPRSWCVDVSHAAARVGPRTRAILGVHAFGHPYDHRGLSELARRHELQVLEDAAQAHGARADTQAGPRRCGGLGDVSVFSFYANKPVTTGEGGMVLCRTEALAARIRDLANLFLRGKRRFLHDELGHNYRLSGVQAALGLSQLARLDATILRKREIAGAYRRRLAHVEEIELQGVVGEVEPIHWMNAVVLSDRAPGDAESLALSLAQRGIETRPLFVGMHEQPALLARGLFEGERYPVTERLSRRGLYLPSGLALDETTIDHVVECLESALSELRGPRAVVPADIQEPIATGLHTPFGALFAESYDAFYADKDYAAEAALLEQCFDRFSERPVRRVLDVGCGTGRHVAALAGRGYDVVGADRSPAMLSIARRRLPGARLVESDMVALDLCESFDAVVILFAALSYQTTPDGILAALRSARRHLTEGGLLVADVWLGAALQTGRDTVTRRAAHSAGVEWERIGRLTRDPLAQRVDVAYELRRRAAHGEETVAREVHPMHYFSPFELEFALMLAGFRLAHLCREGHLDDAPGSQDLTGLFVAVAR